MTNESPNVRKRHPRVFAGGARPVMPRPPEGLGRPMTLEDMREEMERFMRRTRPQGQ